MWGLREVAPQPAGVTRELVLTLSSFSHDPVRGLALI
jgi:hypothetical protein